jgi:hypothetical protein
MNKNLKFCKDCKYYATQNNSIIGHVCRHPDYRDLVTGDYTDCRKNRQSDGSCGEHADGFEKTDGE